MRRTVNPNFFKRLAAAAGIVVASIGFALSSAPAAQAALAEEHPHRHGQPSWFAADEDGKPGNAPLLSLLKLDANTLESRLRAGKSLAEIAEEQGVKKQQVIDLLVAQQRKKIDEAVKAGKVSKQQADEWKNGLPERTRKMVESKFGREHGHGRGKMGFRGGKYLEETAQVLGISQRALLEELKKGKSIAQIGKEKGIAEETLVSKLLELEKARIQDRIHRVWGKANQVKQNG
ncbi:hypothetical protein [Cohnella xylanilytica]|uniref:hypothetical protein n=1 Tax=Cohnella xylanilytica TaxID=557555 RepID=UPI001BB2F767|nr:hypothetical protein [Cohnella xylanilytica]